MRIVVQADPFDFAREVETFREGHLNAGALVTFSGMVKSVSANRLDGMFIEHYPGMTEQAIAAIAEEAASRWDLVDCLIIHRYGHLKPGDLIMMVATLARHRGESFAAAEFMMDYLKSRAPFWKKECGSEGEKWVDSSQPMKLHSSVGRTWVRVDNRFRIPADRQRLGHARCGLLRAWVQSFQENLHSLSGPDICLPKAMLSCS